jgi:hypothetical protein
MPRRSSCSRSFDATEQGSHELDGLRGSESYKLRSVEHRRQIKILRMAHDIAGAALLHALSHAA